MRILYIGNEATSTTSFHRASALKRLGHYVDIRNPELAVEKQLNNPITGRIHYRTGYRFIQNKINKWLSFVLNDTVLPDLIWVDGGEFMGTKSLELLKSLEVPVVLYNVDDPTGKRDGNRFKSLLKALPLYDMVVVVRKETAEECRKLGALNTVLVSRSYDEEAHKPYNDPKDVPSEFRSGIAFIGTWMRHEKRDEFLLKLIDKGLPVSIWGDRWQKSPHWNRLKIFYQGGSLSGRDYVAAIQGAKICIGMLSKGNRDLHTTRSLEIPYIGGLLCAERTSEHQEMYKENEEAVFWSDAEECAKVCKELLNNSEKREKIRQAGMQRVKENKAGNENICAIILNKLKEHELVWS